MRGTKPPMKTDPASFQECLPAPEWISEFAKEEWSRVMPILTERRILTDADLGSLESYCVAIGNVREMELDLQTRGHVIESHEGLLKRNPASIVQSDAMTRARLLAAELGLTPVSRSRPAIRDEEDEDDLSDLDL